MEGIAEAAAKVVTYRCDTPGCGSTGLPTEMWTLDKRVTGGRRVVACRNCRRLAHQEKVKTYRLDYSLKWEEEQRQKRQFFRGFAGSANRNGNGNGNRRHQA